VEARQIPQPRHHRPLLPRLASPAPEPHPPNNAKIPNPLALSWPKEFFTSRSKWFNRAPIEGRPPRSRS
jgi:hypothetical protein